MKFQTEALPPDRVVCMLRAALVYLSVVYFGSFIFDHPGGAIMNTKQFFEQLHMRIAKYDLLCHPFYQAWSAGELTREDLREYARDYSHQAVAFPIYLAELGVRLDESELRRAVLANMADEKGMAEGSGEASAPHAEMWLDFAEGMGAGRDLRGHRPLPEIEELTAFFHRVASEGAPEEALA